MLMILIKLYIKLFFIKMKIYHNIYINSLLFNRYILKFFILLYNIVIIRSTFRIRIII